MTFQEKMTALKERIEGNLSPRFLKIINESCSEIRGSGAGAHVLGVGDDMPGFAAPDQNNQERKSSEILKKGPLLLTFYRGLWCPYCNEDLKNLNLYLPRVEEAGGQMLAISPEKPKHSKKMVIMHKIKFDILHDFENLIADDFGLKFEVPPDLAELYKSIFQINLKSYNGGEGKSLPLPARFVVDTEGKIRYAESSLDYRQRPDPDEAVEILASLGGA